MLSYHALALSVFNAKHIMYSYRAFECWQVLQLSIRSCCIFLAELRWKIYRKSIRERWNTSLSPRTRSLTLLHMLRIMQGGWSVYLNCFLALFILHRCFCWISSLVFTIHAIVYAKVYYLTFSYDVWVCNLPAINVLLQLISFDLISYVSFYSSRQLLLTPLWHEMAYQRIVTSFVCTIETFLLTYLFTYHMLMCH